MTYHHLCFYLVPRFQLEKDGS